MGALVSELRARVPFDPLLRFFTGGGLFYLGFGLGMLAWPAQLQVVLGEPPFSGREEGIVRVVGFLVAVVGWLHLFIARSGSRPGVAASVVDRLLVPLVLVPLALSGVFPRALLLFAVLDPVLALVAWRLLASTAKA